MCQINSEPMQSQVGYLQVVGKLNQFNYLFLVVLVISAVNYQ